MVRIVLAAAALALAASCGGGGGGAGTGGTVGGGAAGAGGSAGAAGSTGAAGRAGTSGQGRGGAGGAQHCDVPSVIVSCTLPAATSGTTADDCEEAYADSTANVVRLLCGSQGALWEGFPCPRDGAFAGCCTGSTMTVANCYYSAADAQTQRIICAQLGNVWCDP